MKEKTEPVVVFEEKKPEYTAVKLPEIVQDDQQMIIKQTIKQYGEETSVDSGVGAWTFGGHTMPMFRLFWHKKRPTVETTTEIYFPQKMYNTVINDVLPPQKTERDDTI